MTDPTNPIPHAGVRVPPPLIVLGSMLLGLALETLTPLIPMPGDEVQALRFLGIVFIIAGIAVILIAAGKFKRAGTNIKPWKPSSVILDDGLYAYSRNPIYVSFLIIHAGVALLTCSLWIAATWTLSALTLRYYVIAREERYLESAFGRPYRAYKKRVHRWLPGSTFIHGLLSRFVARIRSILFRRKSSNRLIAPLFSRSSAGEVDDWLELFLPHLVARQVPTIPEIWNRGRKYSAVGDADRARACERLMMVLRNSDVALTVTMGKGTRFAHGGIGILLNRGSILGDYVTIGTNVTFGRGVAVGNRCYIATGAKILGPLTIGDYSIVGANAVITKDIPPLSVVVGADKVIATITPENFKKYNNYLFRHASYEEAHKAIWPDKELSVEIQSTGVKEVGDGDE